MNPTLRGIAGLRHWLFPPCCAGCDLALLMARQEERPFLCEACEAKLTPVGEGACVACGHPYDGVVGAGFLCGNCGDRTLAVDFVVSAYRGGELSRNLVHRLKYARQAELGRLFGSLLGEVWEDERLLEESWWVVPVPLHRQRQRQRGFNQAEEIAIEFIRRAPRGIRLRLWPGLRRVRQTGHQASRDRKERLGSLDEAFAVRKNLFPALPGPSRGPDPAVPERFLIVDDVVTTASTVSECAAILRDNFCVKVVGAVSVLRG